MQGAPVPVPVPVSASTASAQAVRERLLRGQLSPTEYRQLLAAIPVAQRDAWLDGLLGIDDIPEDGPALPRGCVPYLPCSADALLRMVEHAGIHASDVFIDIGSGLGRAVLSTQLATGATCLGIEVQPQLVRAARELAQGLGLSRCSFRLGDVTALSSVLDLGSVFFLYCPFSGTRVSGLLERLEAVARQHPIRICSVDLPLPERSWLVRVQLPFSDLAIYRSVGADTR